MVSLRKNVIANFVALAYATLIGIVMVPVYVRYLGMEAYGLVGFFTMLNAWFQLLDVGLSSTMGRETARFVGGASSVRALRELLRLLECLFCCVGIAGATIICVTAEYVASYWLDVRELATAEVARAVMLMGVIAAIRWSSGLYRGVINGFERQVWMSGFTVASATARFTGVVVALEHVAATPTVFFTYQLLVGAAELLVLAAMTYRLLPALPGRVARLPSLKPLQGVLGFSAAIAVTASAWVLTMHLDKLILSALLPLPQYGLFAMVAVVAGGVSLIGAPISQAMLPRLTKLAAEGREADVISLYGAGTQAICVTSVSAAVVLALFPDSFLLAWTADPMIARDAAPILRPYAIGHGILALASLPYYLQYARGDLRLHVAGNLILLVLLIPAVFWAASEFGAVGAGYAWLAVMAAYFFLWVPMVHARFLRGLHFRWLARDVAPSVLIACLAGVAVVVVSEVPRDRLASALLIGAVTSIVITAATLGTRSGRSRILRLLNLAK